MEANRHIRKNEKTAIVTQAEAAKNPYIKEYAGKLGELADRGVHLRKPVEDGWHISQTDGVPVPTETPERRANFGSIQRFQEDRTFGPGWPE